MVILATFCALGATLLAPAAQAVGDVNPNTLYRILRPHLGCNDGDPIEFDWNPDPLDPSSLVPRRVELHLERCLP